MHDRQRYSYGSLVWEFMLLLAKSGRCFNHPVTVPVLFPCTNYFNRHIRDKTQKESLGECSVRQLLSSKIRMRDGDVQKTTFKRHNGGWKCNKSADESKRLLYDICGCGAERWLMRSSRGMEHPHSIGDRRLSASQTNAAADCAPVFGLWRHASKSPAWEKRSTDLVTQSGESF